MTIRELAQTIGAEIICHPAAERTLEAAYTSDLLSDVMAHAPAASLLITIQNHLNTVAVATLVNAHAILLCHNRAIPDDMRKRAQIEEIALLSTPLDQFNASCRVMEALRQKEAHEI